MGVNFNFSLEKVLKVRDIREKQALNKFIKARDKKEKINSKLKNKESEQQQLYNYIRNNDLALETIVQSRSFISSNREKIKEIKEELKTQEKKVNKARKHFIDKQKKRKSLDRLKQNEFEKFSKNLIQLEQNEIDDIAQKRISKPGM